MNPPTTEPLQRNNSFEKDPTRLPVPRSNRFRGRSRREKVLINFSGMPIDFFDSKSLDDKVSVGEEVQQLSGHNIDIDR